MSFNRIRPAKGRQGATGGALADSNAPAARGDSPRLVIVGGGMVAQHFLERCIARGSAGSFRTTLISEEPVAPYDRVHLGAVLEGGTSSALRLRDDAWYEANDVELRLKDRVVAIDRAAQIVETASGERVGFDQLVLATGSSARLPDTPGIDLDGVLPYRTLEDVEKIQAAAREVERVAILGGGLLSLEAAATLRRKGCEVVVLERAPHVMTRQLEREGAEVLQRTLEREGIEIRVQCPVASITRAGEGFELRLPGDARLEVGAVVVAVGIQPRDELARDAGLACHRHGGIEVDDALSTSDPKIFAIGECARHAGRLYGFVAPGYAMADVLADRLLGGSERFAPAVASATLKIDSIAVSSVGEVLEDGPGYRELVWRNGDDYRRVLLRDGKLVGVMQVGAGGEFPRLQEAVARNTPVRIAQERRFARSGFLWREGSGTELAEWPDTAVLCTCTGVTCGAVRTAFAEGARTSARLSECTGAGSVCGSCRPLLEEVAGERIGAQRQGAGRRLGVAAAIGLAGVLAMLALGPVPMSSSVLERPSFDFLWRDGWWKQASGYSLLAVCVASLLFSVRKRWSRFQRGSFSGWRFAHTVLGVSTVAGIGWHTGFRMGENLNFALMASLVGVVLLGSLTALVTSLEHRLPAPWGGGLRRAWTAAHVVLFWPMPVLVGFHVLSVYMY